MAVFLCAVNVMLRDLSEQVPDIVIKPFKTDPALLAEHAEISMGGNDGVIISCRLLVIVTPFADVYKDVLWDSCCFHPFHLPR